MISKDPEQKSTGGGLDRINPVIVGFGSSFLYRINEPGRGPGVERRQLEHLGRGLYATLPDHH